MKRLINCSEDDVRRFLDGAEEKDKTLDEAYSSKNSGGLVDAVKIFKDNMYEFEQQASDSYILIGYDISDAERAKSTNYAAIKKLEQRISEYNKQIAKIRETIQSLNDVIAENTARLARINNSNKKGASCQSAFESAIARDSKRVDELYKQIGELQKQITICQNNIKIIEEMIFNLEKIIEAANIARSDIEAAVTQRQKIISDIEYMLAEVGTAHSIYKNAYASTKMKAEEAGMIINSLNQKFFEISDATVLSSVKIELASSKYFYDISKSLARACALYKETEMKLFDTTAALKDTISDDVIRDAANHISDIDMSISHTADDFSKKSDKFSACGKLADAYTRLSK